MDICHYVTLDRKGREAARATVAQRLALLYVIEATVRLRRIVPAAHQVRVDVTQGSLRADEQRHVTLICIEDSAGIKLKGPRQGLVDQVEKLLSRAANVSGQWPSERGHVIVLPDAATVAA